MLDSLSLIEDKHKIVDVHGHFQERYKNGAKRPETPVAVEIFAQECLLAKTGLQFSSVVIFEPEAFSNDK